jgi:hypothetical protein
MHAAPLTDDYRQIDVRRWQRDGLLRPGTSFAWQWSRDGAVRASIRVSVRPGSVVLTYRHRRDLADWTEVSYPVQLVRTRCHLGGSRPWFECPAPHCRRRVAILYGGDHFLCRRCHRLVYPCTRETCADRAIRRTEKIRDRLRWRPGFLNARGGKPKWMRWKTYRRLQWNHDLALEEALAPLLSILSYP